MRRTDLSSVPARQRRQLAVLLLPVATVLLAAGVLVCWRAGTPVGRLAGAVMTLLALLLLGIGYGLLRSVRIQARERRLDEAILTTAAACGGGCDGGRQPGACAATDCAVQALPRG